MTSDGEAMNSARGWGKTREAERQLRDAVARGEHVHSVAPGTARCWNGDDTCALWRENDDQPCGHESFLHDTFLHYDRVTDVDLIICRRCGGVWHQDGTPVGTDA